MFGLIRRKRTTAQRGLAEERRGRRRAPQGLPSGLLSWDNPSRRTHTSAVRAGDARGMAQPGEITEKSGLHPKKIALAEGNEEAHAYWVCGGADDGETAQQGVEVHVKAFPKEPIGVIQETSLGTLTTNLSGIPTSHVYPGGPPLTSSSKSTGATNTKRSKKTTTSFGTRECSPSSRPFHSLVLTVPGDPTPGANHTFRPSPA